MNTQQIEILKQKLGIDLDQKTTEKFNDYEKLFLEKNSCINLISKNDAKFLFEKHIFDSLAIKLFFDNQEKIKGKTLLDIGTGGGFPSIPIALLYDEINVFALDSIRKKITVIDEIKTDLDLKNLSTICDRVENISQKFDYITTRAVAPVKLILEYAIPKLNNGGYFIAYKSQRAEDELKEAEKKIKRMGVKVVDIIEYTLPLEENYKRNLIIFQK